MAWLCLFLSGFCEVGFTFCLGLMRTLDGVRYGVALGGFLLFCTLSMVFLTYAAARLPISTAYPVFTGIGAVGTVLVGILFFHEPAGFLRLFFISTLILSVIGLRMV